MSSESPSSSATAACSEAAVSSSATPESAADAAAAAAAMADTIRLQQENVSRSVIAGAVGGARAEFAEAFRHNKPASSSSSTTTPDGNSNDAQGGGNAFENLAVSQFEDMQEIESLCMQCHEQGITRLLLTRCAFCLVDSILFCSLRRFFIPPRSLICLFVFFLHRCHSIPYFRDVIVYAFECPHCHHRTSDVQSANEIAVHGCRITLNATNKQVCFCLLVDRQETVSPLSMVATLALSPNCIAIS
jgi:hypothetical protein